jgi:hypothetical protein
VTSKNTKKLSKKKFDRQRIVFALTAALPFKWECALQNCEINVSVKSNKKSCNMKDLMYLHL